MASSEPSPIGVVPCRSRALALQRGPSLRTLAICQRADEAGFDEVSLPESRQHRAGVRAGGGSAGDHPPDAGADRHRQPGDPPPCRAGHGGRRPWPRSAARERLAFGVGAAEWTMRALGYDPPGWRPYTNVVETVRALRRWFAGEALGFMPTTFPGRPDGPPGLRPAGRRAHRHRRGQRPDDGGRRGAGGRGPARRAGQPRATRAGRGTSGRRGAAGRAPAGGAAGVVERPGQCGDDRRQARDAVREVLAYYLGRVEGVVIDTSGADPDDVDIVRRTVRTDGAAAGAAMVSDHLIDTFAAAGSVEEVIPALQRFVDGGHRPPAGLAHPRPGPRGSPALAGRPGPRRGHALARKSKGSVAGWVATPIVDALAASAADLHPLVLVVIIPTRPGDGNRVQRKAARMRRCHR